MSSAMRLALVLSITMTAGGIAGCATPSDKEKMSLQHGFSCYNQRDYNGAVSAASTYIEKYPGDKYVDEAFYLRGISKQCCGDRVGAEKDLKEAIVKADRSDLKSKANRALGDMAYDRGLYDVAAGYYRTAITAAAGPDPKKPDGVADVAVFERLGNSLQAMGKWSEATPAFDQAMAMQRDPAASARIRARQMARAFELQFGMFANIANAQTLIASLKSQGVDALPINEMREGKVVWFVRTGKFVTLAEAETARSRLATKSPAPIVVPQ